MPSLRVVRPCLEQEERMSSQPVTDFLKHHFRHFNAASLIEAADAYKRHLDRGGKMLVAMAGAMSTAKSVCRWPR